MALLALAICLAIQSATTTAGVRPLDEAGLTEATQLQNFEPETYSLLYVRLTNLPKEQALQEFEQKDQRNPWQVLVETPFSKAASAAAEAKRKYQPLAPMSLADIHNAEILIYVSASGSWLTAASVENVVIKRGNRVIQPTAKTLAPHEYRNAMNASKTVTEGVFHFTIDTLSVDGTGATVVIIGESRNVEIALTDQMLRQIR